MLTKEQSEFILAGLGIFMCLCIGFAAGHLTGSESGRNDVYFNAALKHRGEYRLDKYTGKPEFEWYETERKCSYCGG